MEATAMHVDLAAGFVVILVIGLFIGVVFDRVAGPSWFARQITGAARTIATSVLIGIAGAFIGFHLGHIFGFTAQALLIWAAGGAIAVLWGWRLLR
jgi:uncharacterized membrane protein YeaQ/YmgE (transglycosylase-associated protein family)